MKKEETACVGIHRRSEKLKMVTQTAVQGNLTTDIFRRYSELVSNLFGAQITGRMVVPGMEAFSETEERARERMELEAVDDYIEQA